MSHAAAVAVTPSAPQGFTAPVAYVAPPAEADASAERARRRESKRIDALTWVPRESVTVVHVDATFGSDIVHRSFHVWYSRAQIACFFINEILPRMSSKEHQDEVAAIVAGKIDELEKNLSNALIQARTARDAAGIKVEKQFTKPRSLRVPKFTYEAGRILALIEQYDELVWLLQVLVIGGQIRNSEAIATRGKFRGSLTRLTRDLSSLWVRAKRSIERRDGAGHVGQGSADAQLDQAAEAAGDFVAIEVEDEAAERAAA